MNEQTLSIEGGVVDCGRDLKRLLLGFREINAVMEASASKYTMVNIFDEIRIDV